MGASSSDSLMNLSILIKHLSYPFQLERFIHILFVWLTKKVKTDFLGEDILAPPRWSRLETEVSIDAARASPCGSPYNGLRSRMLQPICKFRSGQGSNPGTSTSTGDPIPLDQSNLTGPSLAGKVEPHSRSKSLTFLFNVFLVFLLLSDTFCGITRLNMGKHMKSESSSPRHGYNHKSGWLAGMLHVFDFHRWRTKNRPICKPI
ncbi:hypothetical protein YC2023_121768 [Brassica napus]